MFLFAKPLFFAIITVKLVGLGIACIFRIDQLTTVLPCMDQVPNGYTVCVCVCLFLVCRPAWEPSTHLLEASVVRGSKYWQTEEGFVSHYCLYLMVITCHPTIRVEELLSFTPQQDEPRTLSTCCGKSKL